MFVLNIKEKVLWNEKDQEFVTISPYTIKIEHSLLSIRKWESKWHKPFMTQTQKTQAEQKDYVRCMTIGYELPEEVYATLDAQEMNEVFTYMNEPMTATWFSENDQKQAKSKMGSETVTYEIVYYWMSKLNIPYDCEKWHINSLMTLIKVSMLKEQPSKKMSKRDVMSQNRALNEQRKAKMKSKG